MKDSNITQRTYCVLFKTDDLPARVVKVRASSGKLAVLILKTLYPVKLDILDVYSEFAEESMKKAASRKSGAVFGGYYGATQKGPPKPGQGFGGSE